MNESLKEKVKTLAEWDRQFRNDWINGEEMLLKLEDAQKEIDELKRKLQQKYDECKRIEETTASPLWREGARWNMRLIEELLEKEAKTT